MLAQGQPTTLVPAVSYHINNMVFQQAPPPRQKPPEGSNFDRFLNFSTPSFSEGFREKPISLRNFFDVFRQVSDFGMKLMLTVPGRNSHQVCTFAPTLSAMSLFYYERSPQRISSDQGTLGDAPSSPPRETSKSGRKLAQSEQFPKEEPPRFQPSSATLPEEEGQGSE